MNFDRTQRVIFAFQAVFVLGEKHFRKCFSVFTGIQLRTKNAFSEKMLFSWPLNGCKLISVSILPLNSHFLKKTQRELSERETCPRAERERERKNLEELDSDHRPRPHRTPKPIVLDPNRRPRPHRWIVLDPDCRPRSRCLSRKLIVLTSPFRKTDRPRVACLRTQL